MKEVSNATAYALLIPEGSGDEWWEVAIEAESISQALRAWEDIVKGE